MKNFLMFILLLVYLQTTAQTTNYESEPVPDSIQQAADKMDLADFGAAINQSLAVRDVQVALYYMESFLKKAGAAHGENSLEMANALSICAASNNMIGQPEQAAQQYLQAIDIYENQLGLEDQQTLHCYFDYGSFLYNSQQFEQPLQVFKKILAPAKKVFGENDEFTLHLKLAIGAIESNLENFDTSRKIILESLATIKEDFGKDHMLYVTAMNNLASTYTESGNYARAIVTYEELLPLIEGKVEKHSQEYIVLISNLGYAYAQSKMYEKALATYREVEKQARILFGPNHMNYAYFINSLGATFRELNQLDSALFYHQTCAEIIGNTIGKENHPYQTTMNEIGIDYAGMDEYEKAIEYLTKSYPVSNHLFYIHTSKHLAWLYENTGELDKAIEMYRYVCQFMADQIENNYHELSEEEQRQLQWRLNFLTNQFESFVLRNPTSTEAVRLSFENKLLQKGVLLKNKKMLLEAVESSTDPQIRDLYKKWTEGKNTLAFEYSKPPGQRLPNLDSLAFAVNDMETLLSTGSNDFRKATKTISWEELSQRIGPDDLLIDFSKTDYRLPAFKPITDSVFYQAYIIRHNEQPQYIRLFEQKELGNLKATRRLYDENGILHKKLWTAIAPYLKDINRIYYSPDGILHRINLGAIPNGQGQTIADLFDIQQISSTHELTYPDPTNYVASDAVVYGGIDYGKTESETNFQTNNAVENDSYSSDSRSIPAESMRQYRGDTWNTLEWTQTEAQKISTILQNTDMEVQLKMNTQATEESFKAIGNPADENVSPRIIHLATHGYFFPAPKANAKTGFQSATHPLIRSGLIMANANHVWKGGQPAEGKDDGILTAYEIAQMDLSDTELVVLSACETGLGDIEGSEGVYGLQRAFKLAGVKYILMSLWSVKDQKAYEFMKQFYVEMYQRNKSIPNAYQAAQSFMKEKYAQPFNPNAWAGFVLME